MATRKLRNRSRDVLPTLSYYLEAYASEKITLHTIFTLRMSYKQLLDFKIDTGADVANCNTSISVQEIQAWTT